MLARSKNFDLQLIGGTANHVVVILQEASDDAPQRSRIGSGNIAIQRPGAVVAKLDGALKSSQDLFESCSPGLDHDRVRCARNADFGVDRLSESETKNPYCEKDNPGTDSRR